MAGLYWRMTVDLDAYLAERSAFVEAHLLSLLPLPEQRPARLTEALRYAVLGGGKRIRPLLCLAACEAAGGDYREAASAACSVELLHAYTLVHDDLPCMDNDAMRRGQPTVHVRFGETLAVLAGDALQALAFDVLSRLERPGLVAELAEAATAVVAGQVEDIACAQAPTADGLDYIFRNKTAALFRAAARLGARIATARPAWIDQLGRYGAELGYAFQITDDLLDAESARAGDKAEFSCLAVMSADEARHLAATRTLTALAALEGLPGETRPLMALARRLQARLA